MARIPLRFQPFVTMLGDQEQSESLPLGNAYSTGGTRNVYVDKYGRATSILGYVVRSFAPTLALDGSPMRVRAYYRYGFQNAFGLIVDGVTRRQVVTVYDAGEGGTDYSILIGDDRWNLGEEFRHLGPEFIEKIPDFAQLGNQLVITFGRGPVLAWDGATLVDASYVQLPPPTATVTADPGSLDGTYQWRIVPRLADGSRHLGSVTSGSLAVSKTTVALTWDIDDLAVNYEVYRTSGTGAVFFYEGSNTSASFTSSVSDLELIAGRALEEYGDPPPTGTYFVETHAQRIAYLRTDAFPRTFWLSDPGLPYSVFTDSEGFDVTDAESYTDVIVGGTGNYKGMFVVWLERSVWTLSGTGTWSGVVQDFLLRRTDAVLGTVSHRTVVKVPAGAVYADARGTNQVLSDTVLAYLTPQGDVRIFDGSGDTIISWSKQATFKRLTYAARQKAWGMLDPLRNEVVWNFPADGDTEPSIAVAWNLSTGTMTERTWRFGHAIVLDTDDQSQIVVGGESLLSVGAHTYELWSGPTFNGTAPFNDVPIRPQIMTRTVYSVNRNFAPLISVTNRWRWVDLLLRLSGPISLVVEWLPGEAQDDDPAAGSSTVTLPSEQIYDAGDLMGGLGNPIGDADGGLVVANAGAIVVRVLLKDDHDRYFYSRGIRLRLSTLSPYTFSLVGMSLAYQSLDGMRRDFRA